MTDNIIDSLDHNERGEFLKAMRLIGGRPVEKTIFTDPRPIESIETWKDFFDACERYVENETEQRRLAKGANYQVPRFFEGKNPLETEKEKEERRKRDKQEARMLKEVIPFFSYQSFTILGDFQRFPNPQLNGFLAIERIPIQNLRLTIQNTVDEDFAVWYSRYQYKRERFKDMFKDLHMETDGFVTSSMEWMGSIAKFKEWFDLVALAFTKWVFMPNRAEIIHKYFGYDVFKEHGRL